MHGHHCTLLPNTTSAHLAHSSQPQPPFPASFYSYLHIYMKPKSRRTKNRRHCTQTTCIYLSLCQPNTPPSHCVHHITGVNIGIVKLSHAYAVLVSAMGPRVTALLFFSGSNIHRLDCCAIQQIPQHSRRSPFGAPPTLRSPRRQSDHQPHERLHTVSRHFFATPPPFRQHIGPPLTCSLPTPHSSSPRHTPT